MDNTGEIPIDNNELTTGFESLAPRMELQLSKFKEEALLRKLKEFGIEIDLEKERKRRFSLLKREVEGYDERIYYNDGSMEGKLIIIFHTSFIPPGRENDYNAQTKISYY